jgi:hypothetical protein
MVRKDATAEPKKDWLDMSQEEKTRAFFEFNTRNVKQPRPGSLWHTTPLCPPKTMDALEAAQQLHRDIRQWVAGTGADPQEVEFRSAEDARKKWKPYDDRYPLAQIAWLSGPDDWPAGLLQGRSYGSEGGFTHEGKLHYLEPDRHILSMMPLD